MILARKVSVCAVSLILLIFTVAGLFIFPAAASGGLDYSYPHATKTEEVYSDELLENMLGASVSDAEREYLRLHGGFKLSYNYGIPTSYVSVQYNAQTGELSVFASEYRYVAENGVTVVWTPVSAELYSEEKPLTAPEYSSTFAAPSAASADAVTVKYKADFVIERDDVNRLLNLAHSDAVKYKAEIEEKTAEYEDAREKYLTDTQKYNEYVAALALYKQYLSEKRIYDEQFSEYNDYLLELAEYNAQVVKYNEYVAAKEKYYADYAKYKEYLALAVQYQSKLEAYEKYVSEIETVKAQLAVIESTKTPVTALKRTVYSAIMGDTVTSVIANKDAIANSVTGADPATIDRAGVATENLRELFDGFFAIKNESEKYNYYVTNYEGFRDNFAELLRTLDKLYMNRKVRGYLISSDKQEKYLILLAQLYCVTNALSDDPVINYDGDGYFDSNYIIGKNTDYYPDATSPEKILKNEIFVIDTDNAAPLKSGYPSVIEKPDIDVVEEPKMPAYVALPVLPEPVSAPTQKEPTPVLEPVFAEKPGKEPVPYVPTSEVVAIVSALASGNITERQEIDTDYVYSPEISVNKRFVDVTSVTVSYYGRRNLDDGVELLYEVSVDVGTYADYVGALPVKMESKTHTYSHTGWVDADGNAPDLSFVTKNLALYADFTAIEKDYKTSWIVNGVLYDKCPEEPQISPSGNTYYEFVGWEKTYGVDPVTKEPTIDVIWVANFEERQYVKTDTKHVNLSFNGTDYLVDVKGDTKMNISALLNIASGEGGLIINSSNASIKFSYAETMALKAAGVHSVSTHSIFRSSVGGYVYYVTLYDSTGAVSEHKAKLTFESYCAVEDVTHLCLYSMDREEKKTVKPTVLKEQNRIRFTMNSGTEYFAGEEYSIKPISLEGITIDLNKLVARRGELIEIFIEKVPGVTLKRVYVKHSDGKEVDITENSFAMPADDLDVCVDFVIDEYVISFVSENKTIASFICKYGDTVTPPAPPIKASDGKYKYTFVGWDNDISEAAESTVYTAIYKQELILRDDTDKGLQITPSVLKILIIGASLVMIFLFGVIPALTVVTVFLIQKKREKKKSNKLEKE